MLTPPSWPTLGDLADPAKYHEPLEVTSASAELLLGQLHSMTRIRQAEEKIGEMVSAGTVACPCHLAIGQEAVAVGVSSNLRTTDRVFGAHRSHAHFLALGGEVTALFAEVLGKDTGCSKGMGGSMHLYEGKKGFLGSVPIVAGTVSLAVGAALAAQKDGRGDVGVAYFGDGAAEEGSVHESLNFASTFRLPVLFVCENNFFSSHLHVDLRQPANSMARFAAANLIPYEIVDGNDVLAVANASQRLLHRARNGEGPGFLEAVTYRWRGHVGPSEDIDVGVKREVDLQLWKKRDPIRRLGKGLQIAGLATSGKIAEILQYTTQEIEEAWKKAEMAPYPPTSALLDMVYAKGNNA